MLQVNNYIDYQDKKLIVKRTVREAHLKEDADLSILKQWTNADTILRKDGFLYLCETIEEAQIIELEHIQ